MSYRGNRRYISPDDFTDYIGANDLRGNSARAGFDYDAYGNTYEFDVVVLTQPIPMATADVNNFYGSYNTTTGSTNIGNIRFQGRILGGIFKSLHESLPDPCNFAANADPGTAAKIAAMHTTFVSTEGFVGKPPSVGDIVTVTMAPGDFKYNTQYAQFKKIASSTNSANRAAVDAVECGNLAIIFEGFDYENDLGDISIRYGPREGLLSEAQRMLAGEEGPELGGLPIKSSTQTSPFGMRRDPVPGRSPSGTRMHYGIDFSGAQGTLMYPPFSGRVSRIVDPNAGDLDDTQKSYVFGRVEIDHGSGRKSVFLHCSEILVTRGQQVTNETAIAKMGGTPGTPGCGGADGTYWSTGPHLHFEFSVNGTKVNPYTYLRWGSILNNEPTNTMAQWEASRATSESESDS